MCSRILTWNRFCTFAAGCRTLGVERLIVPRDISPSRRHWYIVKSYVQYQDRVIDDFRFRFRYHSSSRASIIFWVAFSSSMRSGALGNPALILRCSSWYCRISSLHSFFLGHPWQSRFAAAGGQVIMVCIPPGRSHTGSGSRNRQDHGDFADPYPDGCRYARSG